MVRADTDVAVGVEYDVAGAPGGIKAGDLVEGFHGIILLVATGNGGRGTGLFVHIVSPLATAPGERLGDGGAVPAVCAAGVVVRFGLAPLGAVGTDGDGGGTGQLLDLAAGV